MKINTSKLLGAALDWAVAKCEGEGHRATTQYNGIGMEFEAHRYSTDWAQAGPIIERLDIMFRKASRTLVIAEIDLDEGDVMRCESTGPTHLIAAMRCYVASELGNEIDIPSELPP